MSALGFILPSPGRESPITMDRWQYEREGRGGRRGADSPGKPGGPDEKLTFHLRASLSLTSSPRSANTKCHSTSAAAAAARRLLPVLRSRTRFCSIFKAGCFVVTVCFKLHLVRSRVL